MVDVFFYFFILKVEEMRFTQLLDFKIFLSKPWLGCPVVLINVDVLEVDAVVAEVAFGPAAVWAPVGSKHLNDTNIIDTKDIGKGGIVWVGIGLAQLRQGWDDAFAVVYFLDQSRRFLVNIDIDEFELDVVFLEVAFGSAAIWAPVSAIEFEGIHEWWFSVR